MLKRFIAQLHADRDVSSYPLQTEQIAQTAPDREMHTRRRPLITGSLKTQTTDLLSSFVTHSVGL